MKVIAKVFLAIAVIGGFFLAGLFFLGRKTELQVSLPKNTSARPPSSPLPTALVIPEEKNYTQKLGEDLANQIISQNPEGPRLEAEGLTFLLNPKKALDEMIERALQAQVLEVPSFSAKDFNVVSDSKTASQEYVAGLQQIANKAMGDWVQDNPMMLLDQGMMSGDYTRLIALPGQLEQALKELQALPVPQSWVQFHREALIAVYQTKSVIPRFLNWQEDPLGTMVALNEYQKIFTKTQLLLNEFAQRAKKEGLL